MANDKDETTSANSTGWHQRGHGLMGERRELQHGLVLRARLVEAGAAWEAFAEYPWRCEKRVATLDEAKRTAEEMALNELLLNLGELLDANDAAEYRHRWTLLFLSLMPQLKRAAAVAFKPEAHIGNELLREAFAGCTDRRLAELAGLLLGEVRQRPRNCTLAEAGIDAFAACREAEQLAASSTSSDEPMNNALEPDDIPF